VVKVSKSTIASLILAVLLAVIIAAIVYSAISVGGYMTVRDLIGVGSQRIVTVKGVIVGYTIDVDSNTLKVKLSDENLEGVYVTALFGYEDFVLKHRRVPGDWLIGSSIIVKGLYTPTGSSKGEIGFIKVTEILVPCHESYSAPPAKS